MLVELTQKVNQAVSKLNVDASVPAFVSEWLRMRPCTKEEIAKQVPDKDGAGSQAILDGIFVSMAKGALVRIKKIPEMTTVMLDRMQHKKTEPAVRCALACILAYVVQPRDLIPDNAPGGYGFLDDAVMVHAGYLNVPPQAQSGKLKADEQYLRFLAGFMPKEATTALQQTVQSLEMSLAFYRMLPVDMLETATGIIVANPLAPITAEAAGGKSSSVLLASRVTPTYSQDKKGRTIVKFSDGGAIAADAKGIRPVQATSKSSPADSKPKPTPKSDPLKEAA